MIGFVLRHRHNPQLLLTDQRTPEKKRADALVEAYRKAYPDFTDFYSGGLLGEPYKMVEMVSTPTGRWRSDRIPYLFHGDEIKLLKRREPTFPLTHVDFSKAETQVLAATARWGRVSVSPLADIRSFVEGLEKVSAATRRMEKLMRLNQQAMARAYDRRIMSMFADIDLSVPEPTFDRERRISKLLQSRDRRQRKRGERLFDAWTRERNR